MARAGQYRELIHLVFAGSSEPDGIGGTISNEDGQQMQVWARMEQLRGSQLLALGKEIDTILYRISIRYRADVSGAERILWREQAMKIQSQTADERRTEITIYAVGTE